MYATHVPVVQQYNNYSPQLLATLPDIDPKQPVRFVALARGNKMLEAYTVGGSTENREVMRNSENVVRDEDIIDPATNEFIKIGYFGGAIKPGSKPKVVYFQKETLGVLEVVPAEKPDLYRRLMFSDFNASNPNPAHRKPTGGYLFDVQRPEKSDKQQRTDRLKNMKAVEFIEMAEVPQLLRLAPKAGVAVPSYADPEGNALRNNFVSVLPQEGKLDLVISLFTADEEELFTLVDSAVQQEVISFDREKSTWKLAHNQTYLCSALPGVKAEDAMVNFLVLPDNAPLLKAIRAEVAKKK